MTAKYQITHSEEFSGATIHVDGQILSVSDDHSRWAEIVGHLLDKVDNDAALIDMIVPALDVSKRLEKLSERVTLSGTNILFDGDPIDNALSQHIMRIIDGGETEKERSYGPLVKLLEKLATNPSKKSRKHFYEYASRHQFAITEDGDFIAYKGVNRDGTSVHAGYGIVDGVVYEHANLPNEIGSVVEIPRSMVDDDRNSACSTGLHAGAHRYANSFGSRLLTVKINPRDVVSVPKDSNNEKLRVARYTVLELADEPYADPTYFYHQPVEDEDAVEGDDDLDELHLDDFDALEDDDDDDDEDDEDDKNDAQSYYGSRL